MKTLDLSKDDLPVERSLGVKWCVETDTFGFKVDIKFKPPTRRGLLSIVSSVYDPLGLAGLVGVTSSFPWIAVLGQLVLTSFRQVNCTISLMLQRPVLDQCPTFVLSVVRVLFTVPFCVPSHVWRL